MSGAVPLLSIFFFTSMALLNPPKESFTHNAKGWVDPKVAVQALEMG
jgi:hypothetical protein